MINRSIKPSISRSFFLFGARGTGKSTLLEQVFDNPNKVTFVDLLSPAFFKLSAKDFDAFLTSLPSGCEWVVVDEVQRSPELLNVVHHWLAKSDLKFALTGSSARKLKRGGANLLAGRASVFNLYPFSHREVPTQFSLEDQLQWGGLPQVVLEQDETERRRILRAYTTTYLREEIAEEQLVRKLEPFQAFLPIAAQMNGKIVNYSKIAQQIGVSTTTVQGYFEILTDTLITFVVPSYHQSIRRRQRSNPKIYFFDVGVVRSLIHAGSGLDGYQRGNVFEHFIFLEIQKLQSYAELDWRISYLRTKDDAEIDLIIERPNQTTLLVEIKSTDEVLERHTKNLNQFVGDFKNAEAFLISNDPVQRRYGAVTCCHWKDWLQQILP